MSPWQPTSDAARHPADCDCELCEARRTPPAPDGLTFVELGTLALGGAVAGNLIAFAGLGPRACWDALLVAVGVR